MKFGEILIITMLIIISLLWAAQLYIVNELSDQGKELVDIQGKIAAERIKNDDLRQHLLIMESFIHIDNEVSAAGMVNAKYIYLK